MYFSTRKNMEIITLMSLILAISLIISLPLQFFSRYTLIFVPHQKDTSFFGLYIKTKASRFAVLMPLDFHV
jgi:hypothetical protein